MQIRKPEPRYIPNEKPIIPQEPNNNPTRDVDPLTPTPSYPPAGWGTGMGGE